MLIVDQLAVRHTRRLAATGIQSWPAHPGEGLVQFAWPFVHLLAAIYFAILPPSIKLLRTRGARAGLKAQRARLVGALALVGAYIAAVMVSLAILNP